MENNELMITGGLGINLDKVYPIGSIYLSVSSTIPNELFGGVWEKFSEGRMLISIFSIHIFVLMFGKELVSS